MSARCLFRRIAISSTLAAYERSRYCSGTYATSGVETTADDMTVVINSGNRFAETGGAEVAWANPPRRRSGHHVPPSEGLQFDTTQPRRQPIRGARAAPLPRPHRSKHGAFHR